MAGRVLTFMRYAAALAFALPGLACNHFLGPTSPDSNWQVADAGHFSLYVRPGSFAAQHTDRLNEVLEDQYAYTVRVLDLRYAGHVAAFLYDSASDAGLESDRSGTGYADTEAVKVVCTPPLDDNLFVLISHEANHVIVRNSLGRPGTYLLNEGIASAVLSEQFHRLGRHFLYTWTRNHAAEIPPVAELADDSKWTSRQEQVSYNASASFLAYLLETSGPAPLKQLYRVPSADFARRFAELYGVSLDQAEAQWRAFCAGWVG